MGTIVTLLLLLLLSLSSGVQVVLLRKLRRVQRQVQDQRQTIATLETKQTELKHQIRERRRPKTPGQHLIPHKLLGQPVLLRDPLTHLPNKVLLLDRLHQVLARKRQYPDYKFAFMILNVDRFKVITDSLGHQQGDQVLISLAERLGSCVRAIDTIARLGGDEFALLLDDLTTDRNALEIAKRVMRSLKQPLTLANREIFITASLGIVLSTDSDPTAEEILRDADIALHRAKEQGKDRFEIFNPEMHTEAVMLMQVETDLRRAVEGLSTDPVHQQELVLFYQPIISLQTQGIVGFEALLRWQHPQRGLLLPGKFLSVAEETGLILPLSAWVLQQACGQLKRWQTFLSDGKALPPAPEERYHSPLHSLRMNVNISSRQFSEPSLVSLLDQICHESQCDPRSLTLEITEREIMSDSHQVLATLKQIKERGIKLCIDDFGTGYSSLSYLDQFPIDMLKIDRSFISRIKRGGGNTQTIRAIITLSRNLNIEVVAEGVETLEQLIQLKILNCEKIQGFFYSQPVDTHVATELLIQNAVIPMGERLLLKPDPVSDSAMP